MTGGDGDGEQEPDDVFRHLREDEGLRPIESGSGGDEDGPPGSEERIEPDDHWADPDRAGNRSEHPDPTVRDGRERADRSDGPTPDRGTPRATDRPTRRGRGRTDRAGGDGVDRRERRGLAADVRDHGDPVRWFLRTNNTVVVTIRDVAVSVAVVGLVALLLLGVSGVWPPLVAVESGSMEPNIKAGDLVFVTAPDRFVAEGATGDTGIVTAQDGADRGHESFGGPGDVIVFEPNGDPHATPIIHRAEFWVEEGDNWVEDRADPAYLTESSCEANAHCPAPHDGFVTKGDANAQYDQSAGGADSAVVAPEWVVGSAEWRIPWLGQVRLTVDAILGHSAPIQVLEGPLVADGPAGPSAASG